MNQKKKKKKKMKVRPLVKRFVFRHVLVEIVDIKSQSSLISLGLEKQLTGKASFFLRDEISLQTTLETVGQIGLVRITSWYPNFNGSHFGCHPARSTE